MTAGTKLLAGAALAAVLAFPLALAASELAGTQAGRTADEIKAGLAAQGYEVRRVKEDDGGLEAYAVKDGRLYEIHVDPATGAVTRVKEED